MFDNYNFLIMPSIDSGVGEGHSSYIAGLNVKGVHTAWAVDFKICFAFDPRILFLEMYFMEIVR